MIILLVGTTGVHHTLVAAHLYLKKNISAGEFAHLDGYCDLSLEGSGFPIAIGCDGYGNNVYTLGLGRLVEIGNRAINGFSQIMGFDSSQLLIRELRIPGDLDIWAASKANWMPMGMGNAINRLVADRVISREFKRIKSEALRLTEQVALLQGVSDNMTGLGFKAG
ncbi:MAG: DUF3189 family protein [Syntrophomonadaceae bacterium]|nr:DUF3189 family protein [Syntrophomonadaceae bacterium]